jgi:hypothetical protein
LPIKFVMWLSAALVFLGCLSFPSIAQQTSDAASSTAASPTSDNQAQGAPASSQSPSDKSDKSKDAQSTSSQGKVAGTSNDRLFYALPNFLTLENAGQMPPLTAGEKFKVVFLGSFDYIQIPWYGFLSGISQAENSEPGYGQGAEGYGKRFGAAFADGTIENFMVGAVFPSMLRQDPRYYQLGKGSFMHRTEYAVSRSFVTRTDSGHEQFNYSEIVGGMVSAAFSTNTYHPRAFITTRYDPTTGTLTYIHNASDRTLPNTASVWGTQLGYDTLTLVVKEFWPDVHRWMQRKRSKSDAPQAGRSNP